MSRSRQEAFLRLIRGETKGFAATVSRLGLSLLSFGYGTGVWFRNKAFDRGWKQVGRVAIPVVSIGNLTLGGTGKTPMVEWVARWYRERNVRVAILSRGYGQETGAEELESELLILDDGFQHRRLHRDLDIVLLDALDPFGQGHLFPRGLLREPAGSLKRADVVVLSRADLVDGLTVSAIRDQAERRFGARCWVESRHAALGLLDASGDLHPLGELTGKHVVAFCGIGNPEGFRRTLAPIVAQTLDFRVFPDHHSYTSSDVADLGQWARDLGAELVLTTQKDFVKLRADSLGSIPLRALKIGLEVTEGLEGLEAALGSLLPSNSVPSEPSN